MLLILIDFVLLFAMIPIMYCYHDQFFPYIVHYN